MISPDRFGFAVFIMSYGITALLLAQAVRCLSPVLVIHHEHIVIRHCAFPGLAPIEIELTADASEFLNWIGLDYGRWLDGFDKQTDYYHWVGGVGQALDQAISAQDETLIHRAWGKFVASGDDIPRVKTRHQPARRLEMERFREWLRAIYLNSDDKSEVTQIQPSKPTSHETLSVTTFTIMTKTTISVDHRTGKTTKLSEATKIENQETRSSQLPGPDPHLNPKPSLNPRCPIPLDNSALQALDYFGQKDMYEKAVANQSEEAIRLYERQRRRTQNREFSNKHEDPAARAEKAMMGQGK